MASKKANGRRQTARENRNFEQERYNTKSLHEDRKYGFFWYSWLWKILRPVMIFLCSLLIVIGAVTMAWDKLNETFLMPVDPTSGDVVTFTIESGDSISKIGNRLEEEQLLRNGSVFKYLVQFQGLTNKISYGTYALSPAMDVNDVITELTSGSQTTERTITIIPGWTIENIADYLLKEGAIKDRDAFLALCNQPGTFIDSSYALKSAQESGTLESRKYALEGYLAPDTYRVFASASDESIIRTLLTQTNTVVDKVFYSETSDYYTDEEGMIHEIVRYETPLTQDETLILASMIEREAGSTEDYAKVSAVFHNRLNAGWKLESDPTATYMTGVSKLALTDADTSVVNGYNTYVIDGLPIGPICNPSAKAIEAALYPNMEYINGGYMFFCAKEPTSGELAFSVSKAEHEANVAQYRPLWEAYDLEQSERNDATGATGDNAAAP